MSAGARIAALLALVLAVLAAGWKVHHLGVQTGRAEVQQQWDAEHLVQLEDVAERGRQAAAETLRRLNKQQENQHAQNVQLAVARRDAASAAGAADRLQQRAEATVAATGCTGTGDAAIECVRKAAARIGDALGACSALAREVAVDADDARARGLKCEADYDALIPGTSPTTAPASASP